MDRHSDPTPLDGLIASTLDDLWDLFAGQETGRDQWAWWKRERDELTYRLLLALTRTEDDLGTLPDMPRFPDGHNPTTRWDDCYRGRQTAPGEAHGYIGDDLTDEDLDDLWRHFKGLDTRPEAITPGWWEDKPHQIAYRLLLRFTRASAALSASAA